MQKEEIVHVLQALGAAPLKKLGQHFLICPGVLEKIVTASDLKEGESILEIGPGLGILTEALARDNHKVVAIEKDRKYTAYLRDNFSKNKRVVILNEDVLRANLPQILKENFSPDPKKYKLVANLPYNITTRFIRFVLALPCRPRAITLLIQKEVAERICAKPPHSNPLALFAQLMARPKIVTLVKNSCFYPKPEVESAIITLKDINQDLDLERGETKSLLRLIKIGFSSPRKTLFNNLGNVVELDKQKLRPILKSLGKSEKARAQELGLEEWKALSAKIKLKLGQKQKKN